MSGRYMIAIAGGAVCLLGLALALVDYLTTGRMSMMGGAVSCVGVVGLGAGLFVDFYRAAKQTAARMAKARENAAANHGLLMERNRNEELRLTQTAEKRRQEARMLSDAKRAADLLHGAGNLGQEADRYYKAERSAAGCLSVVMVAVVIIGGLGAVIKIFSPNLDGSPNGDSSIGIGWLFQVAATGAAFYGFASIVRLLIDACVLLRRIDERDAAQMRAGSGDKST